MFTYVIVTADDKIRYIQRCQLYELLRLQFMDIFVLVAAYTAIKIWKFLICVILQWLLYIFISPWKGNQRI